MLVQDIDRSAPNFCTYDAVRSKVDMELKNTSTIKKNLKARFREEAAEAKEEDEEVDEDEDEQGKEPLA